MKLAIIGGNLLGAATALNLSLVAEADSRRRQDTLSSPSPSSVVIFEQNATLGGNAFKSVSLSVPSRSSQTPETQDLHIEVGHTRCLTPTEGSYLFDLLQVANGARGAFRLLGRNIRVPGDSSVRRGHARAAPLAYPVSDAARLPSFSVLRWNGDEAGEMLLRHHGYAPLDLLARLLRGPGLRVPFLAVGAYLIRDAMKISVPLTRGVALLSPLVLLAVAAFGPANAVRRIHANLAFWKTTFLLLVAHGLTMGIARGAVLGFQKHLSTICEKNVGSCCLSVGDLMKRTELDRYLRASANDVWRKFKYDMDYAARYLEPVVARDYEMRGGDDVNSLAASFSMLGGDWSNMDATANYATVAPENAALCSALLKAASSNLDLQTRLETRVTAVSYDGGSRRYVVKAEDGSEDYFDGIILCSNISGEGDMDISLPADVSAVELLGPSVSEDHQRDISNAASHTAVVRGVLDPNFFGYAREVDVPDRVQLNGCQSMAYFERILPASVADGGRGVYLMYCSGDFNGESGVSGKMFREAPELVHFEPRPPLRQTVAPISPEEAIDEVVPYLVFGTRFIYAAATDRIGRHPELDAIAAMNAASLFSGIVKWDESEDRDDVNGDTDFPEDSGTGVDDS